MIRHFSKSSVHPQAEHKHLVLQFPQQLWFSVLSIHNMEFQLQFPLIICTTPMHISILLSHLSHLFIPTPMVIGPSPYHPPTVHSSPINPSSTLPSTNHTSSDSSYCSLSRDVPPLSSPLHDSNETSLKEVVGATKSSSLHIKGPPDHQKSLHAGNDGNGDNSNGDDNNDGDGDHRSQQNGQRQDDQRGERRDPQGRDHQNNR